MNSKFVSVLLRYIFLKKKLKNYVVFSIPVRMPNVTSRWNEVPSGWDLVGGSSATQLKTYFPVNGSAWKEGDKMWVFYFGNTPREYSLSLFFETITIL